MKFLCNTEFIHSNVKTYNQGTVYTLTADTATQLIALDKKKELGALTFFTPIDEEATKFVKEIKPNKIEGAKQSETTTKPKAE